MKVIIMITLLLIVVGGLGVAIGIAISSRVKCRIGKKKLKNNLNKYEEKKTK
jgi:uncharacterized protein YneF (UPF0154 family)